MLNINQTIQGENNSTNKLLVPGSEQILEQMKMEIAEEMGIVLGADTTSRENGRVGGELTRRLIQMGKQQLMNKNNMLH
ncbi:alpha/beta-type small acid-soluble spore protein [uncultured Metabacillus sp.]|uniref:alpha/beta-type small acid-soluble spore protein n=1 Tax=uncultured Metabacillus sp. TaxID=2860135 RepID=UPI002620BC17|nr:alpha/beta-type small acid-soluble spore protein [uncultured Metabacillus sp.]